MACRYLQELDGVRMGESLEGERLLQAFDEARIAAEHVDRFVMGHHDLDLTSFAGSQLFLCALQLSASWQMLCCEGDLVGFFHLALLHPDELRSLYSHPEIVTLTGSPIPARLGAQAADEMHRWSTEFSADENIRLIDHDVDASAPTEPFDPAQVGRYAQMYRELIAQPGQPQVIEAAAYGGLLVRAGLTGLMHCTSQRLMAFAGCWNTYARFLFGRREGLRPRYLGQHDLLLRCDIPDIN